MVIHVFMGHAARSFKVHITSINQNMEILADVHYHHQLSYHAAQKTTEHPSFSGEWTVSQA